MSDSDLEKVYAVSDGKLTLYLEELPKENGEQREFKVTSPEIPSFETKSKDIEGAFAEARNALSLMKDGTGGGVPKKKVLKTLFNAHLRTFAQNYVSTAYDLFDDGNPDTKNVFHSGEFGGFREALLRDFLIGFLPGGYGVTHGFLVSSTDWLEAANVT